VPALILGEVQVVESLGERGKKGESDRVRNVTMELTGDAELHIGHTYRLFCQDIAGTWHETAFLVAADGFTIRFLGPKRFSNLRNPIPSAVKERGHVATIEHN
jgi:hypothetical protein